MKHYSPVSNSTGTNAYANYVAVVQSSGTGKSRTIDEMSKKHFVIPMNLRRDGSSGTSRFPSPDIDAREYLLDRGYPNGEHSRQEDVSRRICAFLTALFEEANHEVKKFLEKTIDAGEEAVATHFRELMTTGQSAFGQGMARIEFYDRVVKRAKEALCATLAPCPPDSPTPQGKMSQQVSKGSIHLAFITDLRKTKGPRPAEATPKRSPQVVIVFDESHTLTEVEQHSKTDDMGRTNFSQLRRILRGLNQAPLFSLFLSTLGDIMQFSPSRDQDKSGRIVLGELELIPPFTEVGFDHFAIKFDVNASTDLSDVAEDEYICRLGRPLFGGRFIFDDTYTRDNIVTFASGKLLNWPNKLADLEEFTGAQEMAILSQRLALEYGSSNSLNAAERKQVESHMRLCLSVKPGFTYMRTISGSEPLLAEAACYAMTLKDKRFDAPGALRKILSGQFVNQGDRGEVIVLLLLVMARDAAVGPPNVFGRPEHGRVFKVVDFLASLFKKSEDVLSAMPSIGKEGLELELKNILATAHMHFNHFIKVHQHSLMKRTYLARYPARGAGLICGNSQVGIDGVIAFSAQERRMSVRNTGLIIWQVKLDKIYTSTPKWDMFSSMDPATLGIFDGEGNLSPDEGLNDRPVPIIRIVFALAAKKSCLKVRPMEFAEPDPRYRTYDFWCAGLDRNIFRPITAAQENSWKGIRGFCNGWEDDYASIGVARKQLRREMNAGAGAYKEHFNGWCV
ncbi:hypothetical protein WOLCODRAFT_105540 [Wolfiporia cocos MD-104 SS10]|uniref:Uncharacterized protein n=1 Tax=Wolfiporia cocos (strain MD-104) TaxID=742152 RepID=A0A2H3JRC6_WOLCO|nr:hypothetical protein WOLCODRAFT_105540 [Wolfiporia cocos MD-104 SS10]